jgi:hypothetical protein
MPIERLYGCEVTHTGSYRHVPPLVAAPTKYAPFLGSPITAWSHPATGHVPEAHSRITVRRQAAPATTGDGTYFRGRPLAGLP